MRKPMGVYLVRLVVTCLLLLISTGTGCSFSLGSTPADEESPDEGFGAGAEAPGVGEDDTGITGMEIFDGHELGFRIHYPADWIYEPGNNLVVFSGREGTDDYYTTVNLQNLAWGELYHDFQDFYDDYRDQVTPAGGSLSLLQETSFSQNGRTFSAIEFNAEYHMEGEKLKQWIMAIDRGDGAFHQFSYTAPEDLFQKNYHIAEEMLSLLEMTY